jgi:hypothetical protein
LKISPVLFKNFKMIRFYFSFPKLGLGAAIALAAISLTPGSAQAFVVTVGGVQYDVTTFTGTYNANASKFATAANGGVMPWYGSASLAQTFASAVTNQLGLFNQQGISRGPFFSYTSINVSGTDRLQNYRWNPSTQTVEPNPSPGGAAYNVSFTYATATQVAPVPGPLPILGVGAAFGFSRKLRKRIKKVPGALSSHLPQV